MANNPGIQWWGYVHMDGSLHVKRYFSELDIEEAEGSPFVLSAHGPWTVDSREEALKKLQES